MKLKSQRPKRDDVVTKELTDPRQSLEGFVVGDVVRDIELSLSDSREYFYRLERNENTRLCRWEGKSETGRKVSTKQRKAKPWENAADHEVHLAQEVLLQLTAACVAAMQRGTLNVTPMNGTDAKKASQMKLVLRYYLDTCMRTEKLVQGTRWASWARRYGHAVLYIGWKTVKAMEECQVLESEVVEFVLANEMEKLLSAGAGPAEAGTALPGGEPEAHRSVGAPVGTTNGEQPMVMDGAMRVLAETYVRVEASVEELAKLLLVMKPDLAARGKEAMSEAVRCAKDLRRNRDEAVPSGKYYAAFIKEDRPVWETHRTGVDFFCPPETTYQDSFDDARWLMRVRWLSAQQIREEAAVRDWDPQWVLKVIKDCRGKCRMFGGAVTTSPWAMTGLGVGMTSSNLFYERDRYQIVEYYDRRTTKDGVQCLYKTVLHPDVNELVAKRELLPDWHGHYPFVPTTNEQDEPLLMANRGVPEICRSAQNAIKTQWDSRDDIAALTTMPPWTGPDTLQNTQIAPGTFIPEWRSGTVKAFTVPPPDNRSIEIEQTLRRSIDRYFALMSKEVPDALSMLMGQTGVNWFLASLSRAVALTAQLIQQRMSPLTGARITGTPIVFDADRESVRGSFDFRVSFDVRALDMEWMEQILKFVKDAMSNFDQNNLTDSHVLLQMAYDMVDPTLTDRILRTPQGAQQAEMDAMNAVLNTIFSGGVPKFVMGVDYQARSQVMIQDLQSSPVRQRIMQTNGMIAAVWQDYLQKLLAQVEQQTTNKQAGIEGGSDPLKQSPLAMLKAGGWQGITGVGAGQMPEPSLQ